MKQEKIQRKIEIIRKLFLGKSNEILISDKDVKHPKLSYTAGESSGNLININMNITQ